MSEEDREHAEALEKAVQRAGAKVSEKGGLVVIRHAMTLEEKRQRREDNKTLKRSRELHRGAKKHGTRTSKKGIGKPWMKTAKAKAKQKRMEGHARH